MTAAHRSLKLLACRAQNLFAKPWLLHVAIAATLGLVP